MTDDAAVEAARMCHIDFAHSYCDTHETNLECPVMMAAHTEAGITFAREQVDALTAERDQHEKCIEQIQADQLKMAERENELHEQKDRRIADLTAAVEQARALCQKSIRHLRESADDLLLDVDDVNACHAVANELEAALTAPTP